MLVNAVIYTFPADKADEAETMLRELRDLSRAEAGCVAYDVVRGVDDPNVFVLHEEWRDQDALDKHYTEEHFTRLGVNGIRLLARERIGHRCREI